MTKEAVVVTGANGFLGAHVVLSLLAAGYMVHATVRSRSSASGLLRRFESEVSEGSLKVFEVPDLADREAVRGACEGAQYVLHTASPVPSRDMADAVATILDPTLGAIRTIFDVASSLHMRRVVLTTSLSSHLPTPGGSDGTATTTTTTIDETSWNDMDETRLRTLRKPFEVYMGSKTVVERLAWSLSRSTGVGMTTVAPVYIAGPTVCGSPLRSSNLELVRFLRDPARSRIPGWVDVRDVADAHLLALQREQAAGRRLLMCAHPTPASDSTGGLEIDTSLVHDVLGLEYREWKVTVAEFEQQVKAFREQQQQQEGEGRDEVKG
ncbi:flocculosin hydroxylase [Pseudozyma flocculosa PF-1]|uniref:Putative oxidoreductase n=1 Tax=Pseudozyma flocculosa TaxID=84751 RepID=E2JKE0_9BASI|nr:flocculosin hydroxylase [Pseudozyma flocculosa PF-1]ADN97212.1 putative oxidoreductase [Pseudozyma flocculosa]EPQ31807.1 flocculosin hydroxylase [Pseudozyma flocculosa PF-1]SPO35303.1 related to Ustilagic Acid hydroxylase [Pseudozyma flocculosa]